VSKRPRLKKVILNPRGHQPEKVMGAPEGWVTPLVVHRMRRKNGKRKERTREWMKIGYLFPN